MKTATSHAVEQVSMHATIRHWSNHLVTIDKSLILFDQPIDRIDKRSLKGLFSGEPHCYPTVEYVDLSPVVFQKFRLIRFLRTGDWRQVFALGSDDSRDVMAHGMYAMGRYRVSIYLG